ncbi:MAG TPA: sigma-70 family RNA polymerase sigma factor [Kofleriaceae bacterium]|nr:sigma-70 family RNA polymerase sigma factor [Kofleriaceae bacterium]
MIDPSFQAFAGQAERQVPLSREEELSLARRYRAGDTAAGHALIARSLQHVVRAARKLGGYGVSLADLVGEGNLGLIEAARRFEPERGLRFMTYARYWVRAYMLAYVLKQRSIVDRGSTALASRLFFRLGRERARLAARLGDGDDSMTRHLADRLGAAEDTVRRALADTSDRSLDAPVAADTDLRFVDLLPDPEPDQQEKVALAERSILVHRALARAWPALSSRERMIVRERLFAVDEDAQTLATLGREMGVSRERARQIEGAVKSKLRAAFAENPAA